MFHHNTAYEKVKEIVKSYFDDFRLPSNDNELLSEHSYWSFFELNNIAFVLFDTVKVEFASYSNNFLDIVGINKKQFLSNGFEAFVKNISKEHLDYIPTLPKAHLQYWSDTPLEFRKNIKVHSIGMHFIHEKKGDIRMAVQVFPLPVGEVKLPTYLLGVYQDITHLIKDEDYWIRIQCDDQPERFLTYHSSDKQYSNADILSKREKEVLRLLILDYDTDSIAATLFISKTTVNNHRQNMLNKTCARDTTALVSIAKLCNLV